LREKVIIVTNNALSLSEFSKNNEVVFVEGSLLDVLRRVRDYVHLGHKLLTHPLMGSIKPNQTPYKTVAISSNSASSVDLDSLMFIENSLETAERLIKDKQLRLWPEKVLEDYRLIDFDLISNAF
jgi:hypothetical protein